MIKLKYWQLALALFVLLHVKTASSQGLFTQNKGRFIEKGLIEVGGNITSRFDGRRTFSNNSELPVRKFNQTNIRTNMRAWYYVHDQIAVGVGFNHWFNREQLANADSATRYSDPLFSIGGRFHPFNKDKYVEMPLANLYTFAGIGFGSIKNTFLDGDQTTDRVSEYQFGIGYLHKIQSNTAIRVTMGYNRDTQQRESSGFTFKDGRFFFGAGITTLIGPQETPLSTSAGFVTPLEGAWIFEVGEITANFGSGFVETNNGRTGDYNYTRLGMSVTAMYYINELLAVGGGIDLGRSTRRLTGDGLRENIFNSFTPLLTAQARYHNPLSTESGLGGRNLFAELRASIGTNVYKVFDNKANSGKRRLAIGVGHYLPANEFVGAVVKAGYEWRHGGGGLDETVNKVTENGFFFDIGFYYRLP